MSKPTEPLEEVPKPDVIRKRLAEVLQQAQVLRGLLRVSQKAEKLRREAADSENGGSQ